MVHNEIALSTSQEDPKDVKKRTNIGGVLSVFLELLSKLITTASLQWILCFYTHIIKMDIEI